MLEAITRFQKLISAFTTPDPAKKTKWRSSGTKPKAFAKRVSKQRRRNKIARLSRRANRP